MDRRHDNPVNGGGASQNCKIQEAKNSGTNDLSKSPQILVINLLKQNSSSNRNYTKQVNRDVHYNVSVDKTGSNLAYDNSAYTVIEPRLLPAENFMINKTLVNNKLKHNSNNMTNVYGIIGVSVRLQCPILVNGPYTIKSSGKNWNYTLNSELIQYVRFVKLIDGKMDNVFTYVPVGLVREAINQNKDPILDILKKAKSDKMSGVLATRAHFVSDPNSNELYSNKIIFDHTSLQRNVPYLEITNITLTDAGNYICIPKLRQRLTNKEHRIHLEILVPPSKPRINYSNEILYENEYVHINCSCERAKPSAHLHWRESGNLLKSTARSGNIINPARPLKPTIEPIEKLLMAGDTVEIICKVKGANPMPKIFWKLGKGKSFTILNGTYHTTIDSTGVYDVMNILRLTMESKYNQAKLQCLTINEVMRKYNEPRLISHITLSISYPPQEVHLSKDEIILLTQKGPNGNTSILAKITEQVICDSDSNPKSAIRWFINNYNNTLTQRNILTTNVSALLKIYGTDNFFRNSEPFINVTCEISNRYGRVSKDLIVKIWHKPICLTNNSLYLSKVNSTLEVRCDMLSRPGILNYHLYYLNDDYVRTVAENFTKLKINSFPLTYGQRLVNLRSPQNLFHLYLDKPTKYGTYICRAQNSLGISDENCYINILPSDPPLPISNCTSSKINSSVLISCDNPNTNYGFPVQRYMLQAKRGNSKIYKNISESNVPWFNVSHPLIDENTLYNFKVISYNQYGSQDNNISPTLTIRTQEMTSSWGREEFKLPLMTITWIVIVSVVLVMAIIISAVVTFTLVKYKKKKNTQIPGSPYLNHTFVDSKNDLVIRKTNLDNFEKMPYPENGHLIGKSIRPNNYTVCITSLNDAPLLCSNFLPYSKMSSTLQSGEDNNLIYADVDIINKYSRVNDQQNIASSYPHMKQFSPKYPAPTVPQYSTPKDKRSPNEQSNNLIYSQITTPPHNNGSKSPRIYESYNNNNYYQIGNIDVMKNLPAGIENGLPNNYINNNLENSNDDNNDNDDSNDNDDNNNNDVNNKSNYDNGKTTNNLLTAVSTSLKQHYVIKDNSLKNSFYFPKLKIPRVSYKASDCINAKREIRKDTLFLNQDPKISLSNQIKDIINVRTKESSVAAIIKAANEKAKADMLPNKVKYDNNLSLTNEIRKISNNLVKLNNYKNGEVMRKIDKETLTRNQETSSYQNSEASEKMDIDAII
ncbi:unnamed protein product [Gordionus sp. m RMFG-2023]